MNYYDEEIEINKESSDPNPNQFQKESAQNRQRVGSAKSSRTNNGKTNNNTDSSESESDSGKSDDINRIINETKWKNLPLPEEIKDIFQNVLKYVSQTIEVEYHLQPFIPDFVPAVGDVDAFLKVTCPESINSGKQKPINDHIKNMGLWLLDEPSGHQSEPSLISMKLRSRMTNPGSVITQVPIAKSAKDIEKWINEMEKIHIGQNVIGSIDGSQSELDIDNLMSEWPKSIEGALNRIGFPPSDLDCPLEDYVKIVCNLFDIPIDEANESNYITSIHDLFNLYLAVNETYE